MHRQIKGGYVGAFFMAFTLVLVSFSCTAPIVGTVLVEAARGSVLRPIIGMLGFSIAVALPFGFFAFFPSKLSNLPKSGGWLNSVKSGTRFYRSCFRIQIPDGCRPDLPLGITRP